MTLKRILLTLPQASITVVAVAVLFYLTLAPHPLPEIDTPLWEHTDKVVHALMFFGVAWAMALDLMRRNRRELQRLRPAWLLGVMIATVGLGALTEFLQGYMQLGRSTDPLDLAADTVGALMGVATCHVWLRLR
jgi:VanZ family protein